MSDIPTVTHPPQPVRLRGDDPMDFNDMDEAREHVVMLNQTIAAQRKYITALEAEVSAFRKCTAANAPDNCPHLSCKYHDLKAEEHCGAPGCTEMELVRCPYMR